MKRRTDFEDEPTTRVQAPLPTNYQADTRTYHFREERPAGRRRRAPILAGRLAKPRRP